MCCSKVNIHGQMKNKEDVITQTHTYTHTHTDVLFSSVQSLSYVRLFAAPWTAAHQAALAIIGGCLMMLHMKCHDTLKIRNLFSFQATSKKRSFPPFQSIPSIVIIQRKYIHCSKGCSLSNTKLREPELKHGVIISGVNFSSINLLLNKS